MAVNPVLVEERSKATFNIDEVTFALDGGQQETRKKRKFRKIIEEDPEFNEILRINQMAGRSEQYTATVKNAVHTVRKAKELGIFPATASPSRDYSLFAMVANCGTVNPFGLHFSMFLPSLLSQATEEQQKMWIKPSLNMEMIATYAQTEIGHGTFIRGLETTATFDSATDEFVMHSPTVTSTKFWPGSLGKTVTHALVMAQLRSKGKSHGIHMFLVPLRSLKDHMPLPGITIGDIGPKMGYEGVDNGFLRFDNYRIPRINMLMRHAEVTREGEFHRKSAAQLGYLSMVFIRSIITSTCASELAAACTIAIRYSAIRRQTADSTGVEPPVLNYLTQQYKLFISLATAFAFHFAGDFTRSMYFAVLDEAIGKGDHSRLQELHIVSSGMKAYSSYTSSACIEVCRMACGGHGYSRASGIPDIYVRTAPACTYEGENGVLYLQVARALMKLYQKAVTGEIIPAAFSYMTESSTAPVDSAVGDLPIKSLSQAFRRRAAGLVKKAAEKLQSLLASGKNMDTASNMFAVDGTRAAEAHCQYFVVENFYKMLESYPWSAETKVVMSQLCDLFACHTFIQCKGDFLQMGIVNAYQVNKADERMLELLPLIRPNAVPLVDSFDIPDRLLNSVLGRYDGNVYENLLKYAQSSELNKTEVHPSYGQYLKPLMEELKSSKL